MKKRVFSMLVVMTMLISCVVMPVGATANVVYKDWSNVYSTSADDGLSAIPSQYSFTLDGDTADAWDKTPVYQVIDSEEVNGKKNYLIIRLESPAARGRISNSGLSTYNPEVEGSLAYWINNIWTGIEPEDSSYIADPISGTAIIDIKGSLLNGSFKEYLVEKSWTMEGSTNAKVAETTITAKAVIPSASEIDYYVSSAKKIDGAALSTGNSSSSALTRTVKNKRAADHSTAPNAYTNVYVQGESATSGMLGMQQLNVHSTDTKRAWGMFWVSEDFFKNVKVSGMGQDVSTVVAELNTTEQLRDIGYSDDEIIAMGKGEVAPPESVVISVEKAVPGYPVSVVVDGVVATEETPVKWYVSDTADGEYEEISGASGNNWAITNACAGKYIMAKVNGTGSNAVLVGAGLREFNPDAHGGWQLPSDMPESSPEEYKFTLGNPSNEEFTYHMLETEDVNGETQYFILQMGAAISNGRMVPNATDYKFDKTVQKSLADWLNNVWAVSDSPNNSDYHMGNSGGILNNNATAIDTNIKPYLQNHTWLTERAGSLVPDDYTFTGKVALLSVTEFFEHYNKIGKADYGKSWFRTLTQTSSGNARFWYNNDGTWSRAAGNGDPYIYRPVYYLSEDFFKNVKLESAGAEVAKMVKNTITKAEMLSGNAHYTEAELCEIFGYGEELTYQENAVIAGTMAVGQRVVARFNGVTEGATYQWYKASENDGEYEKIVGATNASYVIAEDDLGKYIAVVITAFDGTGASLAPISAKSDSAVSAEKDLTVKFVSKETGTGTATATFEFKNTKSTSDSAVLILAAYDSQGRLAKVYYSGSTAIAAGTSQHSANLTGLDSAKTYSFKAMVWNGMDSMTPLCVDERF